MEAQQKQQWWIVEIDGEIMAGAPSMEEALGSVRELIAERRGKNQFVRSVDFKPATERLALAAADGMHVPAVAYFEDLKEWDLCVTSPPRGTYFGCPDETYFVDTDGIPWLIYSRHAGADLELPHPIDQIPGDADYYPIEEVEDDPALLAMALLVGLPDQPRV